MPIGPKARQAGHTVKPNGTGSTEDRLHVVSQQRELALAVRGLAVAPPSPAGKHAIMFTDIEGYGFSICYEKPLKRLPVYFRPYYPGLKPWANYPRWMALEKKMGLAP